MSKFTLANIIIIMLGLSICFIGYECVPLQESWPCLIRTQYFDGQPAKNAEIHDFNIKEYNGFYDCKGHHRVATTNECGYAVVNVYNGETLGAYDNGNGCELWLVVPGPDCMKHTFKFHHMPKELK